MMIKMDNSIAASIAYNALRSMIYEVQVTPKPGLVDRNDSGAHKDMNIHTFVDSSLSLFPTMYGCAAAGIEHSQKSPKDVFAIIRKIGAHGEKDMFKATKGINTQKGLIFVLGLICAAAGTIIANNKSMSTSNIAQVIQDMTQGIVEKELYALKIDKAAKRHYTAGESLYINYGLEGIRGEVVRGLPSVTDYGLPTLISELRKGLSLNDAAVNTIIYLMTVVEDTNVVWRCGLKGLDYMNTYAEKVIKLGGMSTIEGREAIQQMNKDFIEKNISPGGCADLLATTIMLYLTQASRESS